MDVSPSPSVCVCASLRMATRLVTRHYDRALAPAGISTNGYSILARLGELGPLPLGAFAQTLGMDRSTLSREIAPLDEAGLIDTTADAGDRRRRVLALSAAGRRRVREAYPLWKAAQRSLADEFGSDRTLALVNELNALAGAGT
ncbi:MAG TPA: MarR family winged helix-turn-helix transcriptional regulator [Gaiellaceae bacterium]|nr:MarR family winged helix-turn-helix transcriptional regulator [Gaiellaceae bacterium]